MNFTVDKRRTQRPAPVAPANSAAARAFLPKCAPGPQLLVAALPAACSWREEEASPRLILIPGVADSAQAREAEAELALNLVSAAGAAQ